MNKKKKSKTKTLVRVATLIMGLGFAGSTLAIALSSVFSNTNQTAHNYQQYGEAPSVAEQIQMRIDGYEKVLAREPQNITALEGLAQLHLQTGNTDQAIPVLEAMVEYYPERQEFSSILQVVKQQNSQHTETVESPEASEKPKTPEKSE